jgi:16S rRNA (uracil1498-N3)-methyltransferase
MYRALTRSMFPAQRYEVRLSVPGHFLGTGAESMNLLLFREHELEGNVGWVRGERAVHIRDVLKKNVGDDLKSGVARHGRARGTIREMCAEGIAIELSELTREPPPPIHLIVALPRPLALSRLLHTAASFGITHIDLIRSWKVPRSYFASPRLAPERIEEDLLLGAEQGAQTYLPTASVHLGFRRFVEDDLPNHPHLAQPASRFLLEPEATTFFSGKGPVSPRVSLAFGAEGGFIPSEIESFCQLGFRPVCLGPAILTTEIAVAASLAQLCFLQHARP